MVVVARFSFPHEAHIAKASLEAAGIESNIADEHTVNTQWLYSNAIGGVRLMVQEEDAEQATIILNTDYSDALCSEESSTSQDHCPQCGSLKLEPFTKGKRPAFLVFILLGFPLFFYKHGYKCSDCGHFTEKTA
ncbi:MULTISPECIES: putative signal transducing protein [Vibrio]|uniref:putative signal transducing protein n=1 Tax=Vibrio TaxID=662 RepID=UPI0001B94E66|nr:MULTISPECIES: DUF2007 domain-containing protein [Vibrio]EEX30886.1 hypothetical protein VIC_003828 [Vibrio coralliilyticus ATCC BAA-450]MCM5507500.1 DUF2007 domain-containing protein [Vibrio sp. SCSIO 43169]MDE3896085.1 DUF2007 domain-containing protein [Vibrio sp. CC007]NRF16543.1 DUF2007 domain-containing protein [Vibrio coralliilyticus]NRF63662.1 DUF2007 domain-containing protein [Vibrio coralliilyticus]